MTTEDKKILNEFLKRMLDNIGDGDKQVHRDEYLVLTKLMAEVDMTPQIQYVPYVPYVTQSQPWQPYYTTCTADTNPNHVINE